MSTANYNLPQWANGKVKLVEDTSGNGVIVTLGVVHE